MKRVISLMLAICMMLGVCAISANATTIIADENNDFCVGNVVYSVTDRVESSWKFIKGTSGNPDVFELQDDLEITNTSNFNSGTDHAGLYFPNSTILNLNGYKLTICVSTSSDRYGIYSKGNLVINGNGGSLVAKAGGNCVYVVSNCNINNVNYISATSRKMNGFCVKENITITNCHIDANGPDCAIYSENRNVAINNSRINASSYITGIFAGENVVITENSDVITNAIDSIGLALSINAGIFAGEEILIDNSVVSASASTTNGMLYSGNGGIFAYSGKISISNCKKIIANGLFGIIANTSSTNIVNSKVDANAGLYAIAADDVTIDHSLINATATDAGSKAILWRYLLDIKNSEITANGQECGFSSDYGGVNINHSNIYSKTAERGIFCYDNADGFTTITDSYIELMGSTAAIYSCAGIHSNVSNLIGSTSTDTNAYFENASVSTATNSDFPGGCWTVVNNNGDTLKQLKVGTVPLKLNFNFGNNDKKVSEPDADPETDIELNGKITTMKYGNNTVVLDWNIFNKTKSADGKNYVIDLSKANAKIFDVIVPRDIVEELAKEGKGIEFRNKYGFMIIPELEEKPNSSVVVGVRDTCASYAQVKALGTTHVEAEFNIAYKSNGKEIDGDAQVYIPCDIKEPRLFYVIDDNTMGELSCRVSGGYAVFDRYLDGTYVVCK